MWRWSTTQLPVNVPSEIQPSLELSGEKESDASSNSNDGVLVFQGGGGGGAAEHILTNFRWQRNRNSGAEVARLARVVSIDRQAEEEEWTDPPISVSAFVQLTSKCHFLDLTESWTIFNRRRGLSWAMTVIKVSQVKITKNDSIFVYHPRHKQRTCRKATSLPLFKMT